MATSSAIAGPLTEEAIGELVALVDVAKVTSLQALWLVVESCASGVVQKAVVCYPVYQRAGGFMVVCPSTEEVREFLDAVSGGDDGDAYHQVEIDLVTNRGRVLGKVDCFLVDMPGPFVQHLQRVPKGSSAPQFEVGYFSSGGSQGKPSARSVRNAADLWVTQGMEENTAQEYFTGEEFDGQPMTDQEELLADSGLGQAAAHQDVAALQTQVQQLQQELIQLRSQQQPSVEHAGAGVAVTPSKARPLFTGPRVQQSIGAADWARLNQLAEALDWDKPCLLHYRHQTSTFKILCCWRWIVALSTSTKQGRVWLLHLPEGQRWSNF